MYRVDDSVYIDASLITCAEYQLFIDDMRAQGKNVQPDHWLSFQFPKGQAQSPILGIRASDAIAFCKWLTIRESRVWQYRLPTQSEAELYPLPQLKFSHTGYWISSLSTSSAIIWAVDNSKLALTYNINVTRDRDVAQEFATNLHSRFLVASDSRLDLHNIYTVVRNRALSRKSDTDLAGALNKFIVREPTKYHAAEEDFDFAIGAIRNQIHGLEVNLVEDSEIKHARAQDIYLMCDVSRKLDANLASDLALARDRCIGRALNRSNNRIADFIRAYSADIDLILSGFIDIALNILILKLRRAGLYMAFEGVRIVTERNL